MEFDKPNQTGFTIYSKSGCQNCVKVKHLLTDKKLGFTIVNCDEYILEDKDNFLLFIKDLAQREVKQFPMIFYDSVFIGGYNEAIDKAEKLCLQFEEELNF
jgi:glutaredoxin